MLQQTTVTAVLPYWERFVARFPSLRDLAAASEEEVLEIWSGLGYYRRARMLHRGARQLVEGGCAALPNSFEALLDVPGIGSYTAAAIASIAFGEMEAVVDGNVVRVISRFRGIEGDPRRAAVRRAISEAARAFLDRRDPGSSNQALMEVGATVCRPKAPDCARCPLAKHCVAKENGDPTAFPQAAPRAKMAKVLDAAVLIRRSDGRVLWGRVPQGRPNEGLWELPSVRLPAARNGRPHPSRLSNMRKSQVEALLKDERKLDLRCAGVLGKIRHAITTHDILCFLLEASLTSPLPRSLAWRWAPLDRDAPRALTSAARKLAALVSCGSSEQIPTV